MDEFIITEKDAISWKAALIDEFATAQSMSLEDVVRIFNEYRILEYLDRNIDILIGRTPQYLVNDISKRIGMPKPVYA